MSSDLVVPVGANRAAIPSIHLPTPPPARIYLSGFEYKISTPKVPLPAIANVVKVILKYAIAGGRSANNILHVLTGGGFVASDPTKLSALANGIMTVLTTGASAIPNCFGTTTSLTDVICKDLGGTSAQGNVGGAPHPGVATGLVAPPQCAVTVSWTVAGTWRGGKPRTYVPTPPMSAITPPGSATIDPTFATMVDSTWTAVMNGIPTIVVGGGGTFKLGTVSYFRGHALRPSPIFMEYLGVKVHERLDSQRRRSGPESVYPVTP